MSEKNHSSNVHHGELLREQLQQQNIDIPEFYRDHLKDEEFNSITSLYNLFKKKQFSKARIALLCQILNLSPVDFGKPANYIKPISSSRSGRLVTFNLMRYKHEKDAYERFLKEEFYPFLEKRIARARHSLKVLNYFTKRRVSEVQRKYQPYPKFRKLYFRRMENHFAERLRENPHFRYKRLIQLPVNETPGKDFEGRVIAIVEDLFHESFEHFLHCFHRLGDNFEVYVVQMPVRLFSFFIMDDQSLITQYYRIDKRGVAIPDMLFYNEGYEAKKLVEIHLQDFNRLTEENPILGQRRITYDILRRTVFNLYNRLTIRHQDTYEKLERSARDPKNESNSFSEEDLFDLKQQLDAVQQKIKLIEKLEDDYA